MASQEQLTPEEQDKQTLKREAGRIAQTDIKTLVRNKELGTELGFEAARPLFSQLIEMYRELESADLTLLSNSKTNALIELVRQVDMQFEYIRSFRPGNDSNPRSARDNIIARLRPIVDTSFDEIAKVVAYSNGARTSPFTAEASAALAELRRTRVAANDALLEVKSTLDKARQAAQQVGVVQHATFFKEESDGHKTAARIWLGVTIFLTLLAIGVGWWNYSHSLDALTAAIGMSSQTEKSHDSSKPGEVAPGTTALQIQLAVAKLIIFSVLFSAVVWTGKMYRAHRHNYVINRHRLNALSTFEAFAKATDDQQIKNAVLLQATQCIFGPQPTGYISGENESEGYPQILEIVRGMGAGDKGK